MRIVGVVALALFPAAASAQRVTLDIERIDLVHGRSLVAPVRVTDRRAVERPLELRLDDTRVIQAELFWIAPRPVERDAGHPWVALAPRFRAYAGRDGWRASEAGGSGRWYMIATVPVDAVGQGLWLNDERQAVNWLPDPHRIADRSGDAWASPVPQPGQADPLVREAVASLRASPLSAWRARLIEGTLAPTRPLGETGDGGPVRSFDKLRDEIDRGERETDPVDVLADWVTSRWQLALAWVHAGDPETGERLRAALGGVVDTGDGFAPAFFDDPTAQGALLIDLLNPYVDAETRAVRAQAWLGTLPGGVAWVMSDAERVEPDAAVARLGVVSLAADARLVRTSATAGTPSLGQIEPRSAASRAVGVRFEETGPGGSLRTQGVSVGVGAWSTDVRPISTLMTATPPGVRLGPLLRRWTMRAWIQGRLGEDVLPQDDASCALFLYRTDTGEPDPRTGWRLVIEARSAGGDAAQDTVRVFAGDGVRIEASGTGFVVVDTSAGRTTLSAETVRYARTDSGWVADVALPAEAVDPGGLVRIGVIRSDAHGEVTSWPRRTLPWQDEPGRLAFDLTGWDGLGD